MVANCIRRWFCRVHERPMLSESQRILLQRCVRAISETGYPMFGQVKIDDHWLVWSGPHGDLFDLELKYGHYVPLEGIPGLYVWIHSKDIIGFALGSGGVIRATLWPPHQGALARVGPVHAGSKGES